MLKETYFSYRKDGFRTDTIHGVPWPSTSLGSSIASIISSTRDGGSTPHYRDIVKAGGRLPVNLYSATFYKYVGPSGECLATDLYGNTSKFSGQWVYGWPAMSDFLSITPEREDALLRALNTKMLLKVKGETMNIGVILAESSKVSSMIYATAKKLGSAYTSLRHGDFIRAVQHLNAAGRFHLPEENAKRKAYLSDRRKRGFKGISKKSYRKMMNLYEKKYKINPKKAAADTWLELQYGWVPLLSDVVATAETFARLTSENEKPAIVRKTGRNIAFSSDSHSPPNDFITHRRVELSIQAVIRFVINSDALKKLGSIGLVNPLEVAWEVLPFSFVIDWFLPVGKWIEGFDATIACTFLDGSYTWRTVDSVSMEPFPNYFDGTINWSSCSIKGSKKRTRYSRVPMMDFPPLQFPVVKNPISTLHVANALALLTNVFKR